MTDIYANPFLAHGGIINLSKTADAMPDDELARALDDLRAAKEAIEVAAVNLRNIQAARRDDEIKRLREELSQCQ